MRQNSTRGFLFLQILKKAKHGTLELTLPDGKKESYGDGNPLIRAEIRDWAVLDLLFSKGDLGLAEVIIENRMTVDDLVTLIAWACHNEQDFGRALHGTWYGKLAARIRFFLNRNDREGAKKNIMAHYDLGNEFYKLWLDPSMSYSSAIFEPDVACLQEAQMKKYDRIIDSLEIKPGDHILEIGCGWGGFFSRAVERTGCKVTAVMNSPQQARHNQQKINAHKLSSHVDLRQIDYRDIRGKFDKVVSIEMIEAVGEQYWSAYFAKIRSSLKEKGSSMIQGITIRDDLFHSYRRNTDFIQQYIFPGGMILANQVVQQKGQEQGLNLTDTYEFGLSYAETLKEWRQNFQQVLPQVKALGFDDKFIRLWNLYLCYCEGAFRAGRTSVGQFRLDT
jgi:cyclopropane-fatty-acyl-phospholipid synthase